MDDETRAKVIQMLRREPTITVVTEQMLQAETVGSTDWVGDCERRYKLSEMAERELRERINALRRELTTASRTRAERARELRAAKSPTGPDEQHGRCNE